MFRTLEGIARFDADKDTFITSILVMSKSQENVMHYINPITSISTVLKMVKPNDIPPRVVYHQPVRRPQRFYSETLGIE